MINPQDDLKADQQFHGHKCTAMSMGSVLEPPR